MDSGNSYKYITAPATTLFAGNEVKKVVIHGIEINKTLTGTLTLSSDASAANTTIGIMAAGTSAGSYWISTNGISIQDFAITNSATEDVTVIYTNIG